jgi:hypothetical protein
MFTDLSEERIASIFRIEHMLSKEQARRKHQAAATVRELLPDYTAA